MSSTITALTSGGGISMAGDTSGQLELKTNNGTTAVTIDTSQRVGIGGSTVTDAHLLNIQGSSATNNIGVVFNKTNATAQIWGITNTGPIAFYDYTANAERMRIDTSGNLLFNSGYGSVAKAYGCRAWVNFDGTGTVSIRGSGNVSSITDNGTGNYTVNFTTAMTDVNFATEFTVNGSAAGGSFGNADQPGSSSSVTLTTRIRSSGSASDEQGCFVSVFR